MYEAVANLVLEAADGSRYESLPETFFLAHRGSIAHGMFIPSTDPKSIDDIDLMGFVFGQPEDYFGLSEWGSRGTKEIKAGCYDVVLYEIRKAVVLLLQGNPNIMSMLWVKPPVLVMSDAAKELIANRHLFLGKHVYNAFAGYAHQQMEKMETRDPADLRLYIAVTAELKYRGKHPNQRGTRVPRGGQEDGSSLLRDPGPSEGINPNSSRLEAVEPATTNLPERNTGEAKDVANWDTDRLIAKMVHYHKKGENLGYMGDKRKQLVLEHGYDSKNAAHLIRLLRMCVEFMKTGEMVVWRPDAEELLNIKRGKWTLDAIKAHAADLFAEAKAAKSVSSLPDEPDRDGAGRLLVKLVRQHLAV